MMEAQQRRTGGSLIERAAEVYDFGAHLRARETAPEDKPAPSVGPAPLTDTAWVQPASRVPLASQPVAHIDRDLLADRGLLVPGAPVGALAEEFRLIKRHLLTTARAVHAKRPQAARTILVCAAQPNDGKTYCAVNLALSMAAERDIDVLLVDADFAKPDVMERLALLDSRGFLDALAEPTLDVNALVVPTDVPNLSVLPAGTKSNNDTELVASSRTADMIGELLAANPDRLIIFDSPPVLAASSASVLAEQAGQVMLVVRADRTSESDVREAVQLLDACEHIQLVLNAVSHQPGGRRYGSYYRDHEEEGE